MFDVGERVVCIDDTIHPEIAELFIGGFVRQGITYTVRECELGRAGWSGDAAGLVSWKVLVAELYNPIDPSTRNGGQSELGFASSRFATPEQLEDQRTERAEKLEPACAQ